MNAQRQVWRADYTWNDTRRQGVEHFYASPGEEPADAFRRECPWLGGKVQVNRFEQQQERQP